jgi:mannan endo-1,4-beta-mannosidase
VVYYGSLNGYMYALDATDGALLWEHQGAGASNAGPAIVDGKLYWGNGYQRLGPTSTTFYAFSLPTRPTTPPTTPPTTTTPPSTPPTTAPTTPPTTAPAAACSVAYRIVSQWSGGFQGQVEVRAGATAITGWTVRWSFPNGQRISQLWSGSVTSNGANVTVRNAPYNGSLGANGTATFGFLATWNGSNTVPTSLTCTSP